VRDCEDSTKDRVPHLCQWRGDDGQNRPQRGQGHGRLLSNVEAGHNKGQSVLAGQTTDLHRVMIATEKANIALQLAIEVRNKVVSAYEEIMRMPV